MADSIHLDVIENIFGRNILYFLKINVGDYRFFRIGIGITKKVVIIIGLNNNIFLHKEGRIGVAETFNYLFF